MKVQTYTDRVDDAKNILEKLQNKNSYEIR